MRFSTKPTVYPPTAIDSTFLPTHDTRGPFPTIPTLISTMVDYTSKNIFASARAILLINSLRI